MNDIQLHRARIRNFRWNFFDVLLKRTKANLKSEHAFDYRQPITMFITFQDFLMVEQIFLSPQVKQNVIISNKLVYQACS